MDPKPPRCLLAQFQREFDRRFIPARSDALRAGGIGASFVRLQNAQRH